MSERKIFSGNPSTFVEILRWRALHQPDQRAFTFLLDGEREESHLTYGELDRQARAIGALLQNLGAYGERVLLLYLPGLEFIAAFFGCLYAGAIAVPAYPPRNKRHIPRLQMIVDDAQTSVSLALSTEKINTKIQAWLGQNPTLTTLQVVTTDNIMESQEENWREPDIDGQNLAFLQYTSGSTAAPKGVMVSHGNLVHNSGMIYDCFGHSPESRGVIWLPPYHDMGLIGGILQPVFGGFHVILMSPTTFLQRPIRWLEAISKYRATTSGGPDFAYDLCIQKITPAQLKTLDLSSWNLAFNGAEPIHHETFKRFSETFEPCGFRKEAFYPCYGLAEATLFVSGGQKTDLPIVLNFQDKVREGNRTGKASQENKEMTKLVGCGHTLPGQQIEIVNPKTLTRCLPEQEGEIWVSGLSIAQGYWKTPEETDKVFKAYLSDSREGPFLRTGDLGIMKDGELFVTGRLKDLIIIRGRNYYPQDIEWTVEHSHPLIRPKCSAVFSVDIADEERLIIVTEVERRLPKEFRQQHRSKSEGSLSSQDFDEVITNIRQAVAEYFGLPVHAVLLLKATTIPRTSSGKIRRYACRTGFLKGNLDGVAQWIQPLKDKKLSPYIPVIAQRVQRLEDKKLSPYIPQKSVEKGYEKERQVTQPSLPKQPQKVEVIQDWLISHLAQHLNVKPQAIDVRAPFARYGVDSVQAVSLSAELEDWLGFQLSPTLLYDYPNIAVLSRYLAVSAEISDLTAKVRTVRKTETETIAVIGLSCRFPGAKDPETFWEILQNGEDTVTEVPLDRWDVNVFYDPVPGTPGKMNSRWGGFLEQVDQFDPLFFGISPREAESMDPQQRILLEVAWEALENAGQAPDQLDGSYSGVFIGISNFDYSRILGKHTIGANAYAGTGNALSIAANRLSYLFDFRGPSLSVDTACSSSLVAVHQACLSLHHKECDLALAGGVNLILTPEMTISLSQSRLMASDGRCKAFDSRADGYVRGEGCGIVVLKRLSDALRDRDNILALIRGSAVNQDGRSNGLTSPNGFAQQTVIYQALENAGVAPSQISYFEAHGTGTVLGDPIEVNALKEVLMTGRSHEHPCWIGSAKTNIGHLEAASGIAALIKVVLALQHEEIPPHLHLKQLNPHISLEGTPFSIPTERQKWIVGKDRRLAGVNSFGFGGTNAHIILEETLAKAPGVSDMERPVHLLVLSAKDKIALKQLTQRYAAYLVSHPEASLADICFTANTGRSHFEHRLAIVTESTNQLCEQLKAFVSGKLTAGVRHGQLSFEKPPKIAFLFTGRDSQYVDMGRQLYDTQPAFRQILTLCDEILRPYLEIPLLEVLYPGIEDAQSSILNEPPYNHLAIFALEYALAELWQSWGIMPSVVMGHNMGEYAAACTAGVFSPEDGLKLIAEMEPLLKAPGQVANRVKYYYPQIDIISNVQGRIITEEIATPEYWTHHIWQAGRFAEGMEILHQQGCDVLLEIGPEFTVRQSSIRNRQSTILRLPGLRRERSDWQLLLESLGELYVHGVSVDWHGFDRDYLGHRVALPSYPFQRQRYWIDTSTIQAEEVRQSGFLDQLKAAPEHERRNLLLAYLHSQFAKVLGLRSPDQIEPRQRLFDLGLDSLMALELKNRLEATLGRSLRSTLLFDYPTLEALVEYLLKEILASEGVSLASSEASQAVHKEEQTELTDLDQLSKDEIGALLDEKLGSIDV